MLTLQPSPQLAAPQSRPHTASSRPFQQLLGRATLPTLSLRRGRKPRVPLRQLLPALVFHFLSGRATLAQHFLQLFGQPLADSSWSERRARRALRPRARRRTHPEAFWRGWRLLRNRTVEAPLHFQML
ncbi:MAG: hypothetical protein RMJ82_14750 [Gemmatales bacterium]|nr:hypothetical protein [Gemmatales bacterium]